MVVAIDNFFGCYLLYSVNPKCKGRTYIGFTVNPERRISQHNAGKHKGGAWRTSGRGPWHMVLVVHGFPSDIAALRFEWAWQNPDRSRRLKHVAAKTRKESQFQFRVRVMAHMINQTPWKMLPLTVRWLMQEYAVDVAPSPPLHMPLAYGPVTAKRKKHAPRSGRELASSQVEPRVASDDDECPALARRINSQPTGGVKASTCGLCASTIRDDKALRCLLDDCGAAFHAACLARRFAAGPHQLVPVEGECPTCGAALLWGDLIRRSQGFVQYLHGEV